MNLVGCVCVAMIIKEVEEEVMIEKEVEGTWYLGKNEDEDRQRLENQVNIGLSKSGKFRKMQC